MQTLTQNAFRALADPTRRDIVKLLASEDMTIGQLTDRFDMTRAAVKKHLTVLSDGGLITVEARGPRTHQPHRTPPAWPPVLDWLSYLTSSGMTASTLSRKLLKGKINDRICIAKTIFLRAEPETVWAYLTEPDRLAEWFHKPQRPLAKGQKLEMYGTTSGDLLIWGDVREARAPEYLEYTFTVKPMGDAVSVVKWTLTPVAGGTRLSLLHEGLPQKKPTPSALSWRWTTAGTSISARCAQHCTKLLTPDPLCEPVRRPN